MQWGDAVLVVRLLHFYVYIYIYTEYVYISNYVEGVGLVFLCDVLLLSEFSKSHLYVGSDLKKLQKILTNLIFSPTNLFLWIQKYF